MTVTHYATVEHNESMIEPEYGYSACGREYFENSTNKWQFVSCKQCLKRKEAYEREVTEAYNSF